MVQQVDLVETQPPKEFWITNRSFDAFARVLAWDSGEQYTLSISEFFTFKK